MAVDVLTQVVIERPREEVFAFAADPSNATAWYKNIETVEWETEPPVAVGSRMRRGPCAGPTRPTCAA
jgi:uncharacterized protein YndB with AHSA1/START domain